MRACTILSFDIIKLIIIIITQILGSYIKTLSPLRTKYGKRESEKYQGNVFLFWACFLPIAWGSFAYHLDRSIYRRTFCVRHSCCWWEVVLEFTSFAAESATRFSECKLSESSLPMENHTKIRCQEKKISKKLSNTQRVYVVYTVQSFWDIFRISMNHKSDLDSACVTSFFVGEWMANTHGQRADKFWH